jgi:hypothetical protein
MAAGAGRADLSAPRARVRCARHACPVRQGWGKLTDDDFDQVKGQREHLVGRVQERYGIAREEEERA